jgi:hypothetical protein
VHTLDALIMDDTEDDTRDCIRKSYEFLDEARAKDASLNILSQALATVPSDRVYISFHNFNTFFMSHY